MSAKAQVLEYMAAHRRATTREISESVEASQGAIYMALTELVQAGDLVRVKMGVYGMPGDAHLDPEPVATKPPAKPKRKRAAAPSKPEPLEPPPVAASESATGDPPIELAVWHTGELTVRRAEDAIVLTAAEVGVLMRFLSTFAREVAR